MDPKIKKIVPETTVGDKENGAVSLKPNPVKPKLNIGKKALNTIKQQKVIPKMAISKDNSMDIGLKKVKPKMEIEPNKEITPKTRLR